MPMLELFPSRSSAATERSAISSAELDLALTAQCVVAWAGEGGEERRLCWWRSDLLSEFGGIDLFQRLLPATWEWAVLQAAREMARRVDESLRRQHHTPDHILSLFSLGFDQDERIEERLQELKSSGRSPAQVLPGLSVLNPSAPGQPLRETVWEPEAFRRWVARHGEVSFTLTPIGRRLTGAPPKPLGQQVQALVAGLAPLGDAYPLPHFERSK